MTEPDIMRCIVVTPNHPVELQDLDVERPEGAPIRGRLLYVRLPVHFELAGLDHKLDSVLAERTDEADMVVVKCHRRVYDVLSRSDVFRGRLRNRFPWARILLLRWSPRSASHEVVTADDLTPVESGGAQLLLLLRAVDFQASLDEPGATLPQNAEFHYEGPNGLHYEQFIRAGYAFQSIDAIEGAAFWMLPYLNRVSFLVFDSWTMLGFGHTVAAYAAREAPGRTPEPPAVECAEEYAEGIHLQHRLAAAAEGATAPRVMVVTSVHSTGNTESFLREACKQAGLKVHRVVRLFGNGHPEDDAAGRPVTLHELPSAIESSPPMLCSSCLKKRKALVPIDPRSLLLALTAAVQEARVTRTAADPIRSMLERYGDVGPFSVHRTQPGTSRHHMIYVDVEKLLKSSTFRKKATAAASQFRRRVDVVLSPTHPAAAQLAELVAKSLGVRHVACEQKAYENLTGPDREALHAAESVLFVDDVAITGSRIRRVKQALMQSRIITDKRDVDVHMLVGVARPDGPASWNGVTDMVGEQNLVAVERIDLPNWGIDECPWCEELQYLLDYRTRHQVAGPLLERMRRLENVTSGLTSDLFLVSTPDAGGVLKSFRADVVDEAGFEHAREVLGRETLREFAFSELGQGSIFGRLKELELFVAAAASLQRLRNDKALTERHQYPLSRVLDPYLYFLGRFYANIIVACLLRAARRRDVRTVDLEPVLRKAVGERLLEPESLELRAELLLAIARTHLPLPQEASQREMFMELEPSVRDFVHWLLNGR